jgi:cytochrome c
MLIRSTPHRIQLAVLSLAFTGLAATAFFWRPAPVSAQSAASAAAPASVEFYTQNVQPILKANCYRCHGGINHRGGLNFETRTGLMHGGRDGAVLNLAQPEDSLLIKLIRHEGPANDPMPMPPKSKLSDADIATVTAWIKAGAIMPPDSQQ